MDVQVFCQRHDAPNTVTRSRTVLMSLSRPRRLTTILTICVELPDDGLYKRSPRGDQSSPNWHNRTQPPPRGQCKTETPPRQHQFLTIATTMSQFPFNLYITKKKEKKSLARAEKFISVLRQNGLRQKSWPSVPK